ncbi:unnamed protein product [Adineta ricciae]|uniref:BPTI/Kunitz inhibitor domain-containing protein n=1 Tax=Adineta ricciae TaxID=249248 RepID=A0A813ZNH6_ADIRI|nr:unnamed protein product [Adineta ricciae]
MVRFFTPVLLLIVFVCIYQSDALSIFGEKQDRCAPMRCEGKMKQCQYGFQKRDGCEICKCHDPCNPGGQAFCKRDKCHVERTRAGTFVAHCGTRRLKRSENMCLEKPKIMGNCKGDHPRFSFVKETGACEKFTYGGCGGTRNNFKTKKECESSCRV